MIPFKAPQYKRHFWVITGVLIAVFAVPSFVRQIQLVKAAQDGEILQEGYNHFVVVSFPKITKKGKNGSLSLARFKLYLKLIKEKGFTPIGLHELYHFYYENAGLPHKPVVLIFEGFREELASVVRSIDAFDFKAVMALNVAAMQAKDVNYISWHDAGNLHINRRWDVSYKASHDGISKDLEILNWRLKTLPYPALIFKPGMDTRIIAQRVPLAFSYKTTNGFNSMHNSPHEINQILLSSQWSKKNLASVLDDAFNQYKHFGQMFGDVALSADSLGGETGRFIKQLYLGSNEDKCPVKALLLGLSQGDEFNNIGFSREAARGVLSENLRGTTDPFKRRITNRIRFLAREKLASI